MSSGTPTFWGHKKERAESLKILGMLDDFLAGILEQLDLNHSLALVVSDHGNFEDWTTTKHTKNPTLTLLAGEGFEVLVPRLYSLADIKPAILAYLLEEEGTRGN